MIQAWYDYRLHLNALFSERSPAEQRQLLEAIQQAVNQHLAPTEEPVAIAPEPEPDDNQPAKGVSWDKVKGKWRVVIAHKGVQVGYGRFGTVQKANAQAAGVRRVLKATGRLPKAGWRAPGL